MFKIQHGHHGIEKMLGDDVELPDVSESLQGVVLEAIPCRITLMLMIRKIRDNIEIVFSGVTEETAKVIMRSRILPFLLNAILRRDRERAAALFELYMKEGQ